MRSNNTRPSLSMLSIFAASIQSGNASFVLRPVSMRKLDRVQHFQDTRSTAPRTGEKVTLNGDLNAVIADPVGYVGYLAGEAADKAGHNLETINREELKVQVGQRITQMMADKPNMPMTSARILNRIQAVVSGNRRRSTKSRWSVAGEAWADALFTAILAWASNKITTKGKNKVAGLFAGYVYGIDVLPSIETVSDLDIATAQPLCVYAIRVTSNGKMKIIGAFETKPMIKGTSMVLPNFITFKQGTKSLQSISTLFNGEEIDGNTLFTKLDGEMFTFSDEIIGCMNHSPVDLVAQFGIAVHVTDGNRKVADTMAKAYANLRNERRVIQGLAIGGSKTVNTTPRSAFANVSRTEELVATGASSPYGSKGFGYPTS